MMTKHLPPVKPIEGYYALLRGMVMVGPLEQEDGDHFVCQYSHLAWESDGTSTYGRMTDIIAIFSLEDTQAVASGYLKKLRTANDLIAPWLSAATVDMQTGSEFRKDIEEWFELVKPEVVK
jgi:hypothetical protein